MNIKKLTSIICGSIILGTAFFFCGCGSESTVNQNDNIENIEPEIISDEADKSETTDNIAPEHVYSHDELLAAINEYTDAQSEIEPLFYDFNGDGKEEAICEFGRTITEDGNDFYQQYFIYTDGEHTFEFGDLAESVYYSSEYNLISVDDGYHFAVTTGWRSSILGGYYSSSVIYELTSDGVNECFLKWFCNLKEPGNSNIKIDYYEEAVAGGEVVMSDVLYWNGKEYSTYK
ncbi:hypothetical protein [Lutispora thermophila]|uniref:Uncharacterized protein n=1 Tax=Lutispora thermophila DSM 19022 TaxID=1122184 RepID=A0A1M6IEZ5_9FIRM|nr:hypothetical protein [Lutispora thermophila]SHJ32995.1 hypothetical protein SAMN02745176_03221 [Lutispora thermophila DSM 19022]